MLTLDTKNFPEGPERYAVPADRSFIFATGIENSYPTIRGRDGATVRVDQMAKSGHYDRWREDFGLVRELDIEYLRYGPPYHLTHLGPGRYDWSFADETFRRVEAARHHPDRRPLSLRCAGLDWRLPEQGMA